MDKVLVVQMARLGDCIQTTPLLKKLKTLYPGCEVHLVTDKSLRDLVRGFPELDQHHSIDLQSVSEAMEGSDDLSQVFTVLHDQVKALRGEQFDAAYNLNYSFLSAAISEIPTARHVYGYRLSKDRNHLMRSPWFAFFNAMVRHIPLAPFNVADFFRNLASPHVDPDGKLSYRISKSALEKAGSLYKELSGLKKIVAVQLATRSCTRMWPVPRFSETVFRLLDSPDVGVVLTGVEQEEGLGREFEKYTEQWPAHKKNRICNLIGKTSIEVLAGLLSRCCILLTGDTGVMHLAAAVGTKIVALFFGPAIAGFTGPYGEGHVVIQATAPCSPCSQDHSSTCACNMSCRNHITPQLVVDVINHVLYKRPLTERDFKNVSILKSRLDKLGITYEPINNHKSDTASRFYRIMGSTLLQPSDAFSFEYCDFLYSNSLLTQIETLLYVFRKRPSDIFFYRHNDEYSLWHPWIDFYFLAKRYGMPNEHPTPNEAFIAGMSSIARSMKKHRVWKNTEPYHVH